MIPSENCVALTVLDLSAPCETAHLVPTAQVTILIVVAAL